MHAIIAQAATDYAKAYMGYQETHLSPEAMMKDCEKFFKSEQYRSITDLNSDLLMQNIKKNELNEVLDFIYNFKQHKHRVKLIYNDSGARGKQHSMVVPPRLMSTFENLINTLESILTQEREELKCTTM